MPESRAAEQWRPAVITAAGSALAVVVLATVVISSTQVTTTALETVRTAVRVWLVSIGATLTHDQSRLDVVPIGATMLVIAAVFVLTRVALRTPVVDPGAFGAMAGGVAGVLAALSSALTSTEANATSFIRAAFGAFVVVGLPAAWAASRRSNIAWLGLPARWTPVADGAVSALTTMLAGATTLTLVMLALHLEQASDLWATLDPGGPLLLGLLCVLAFPTLVLWTTSLLLGPGFAVGTDTSVDLTGSALGPLPAFPPLAGLPDPGPFGSWTIVLMSIPAAAGVVAGLVSYVRGPRRGAGWARVTGDGAAAGAVAGALIGVLVETARGGLGPGVLQTAGPPAWQCLLIAVPLLATGGAIGAAAAHYRSARDRSAS